MFMELSEYPFSEGVCESLDVNLGDGGKTSVFPEAAGEDAV
jgi:hypothetical protein